MRRLSFGAWRRGATALLGAGVLSLGSAAAAHAEFKAPYNTQCSGAKEVQGITSGMPNEIGEWENLFFSEEDHTSSLSCAHRGPSVYFSSVVWSAEVLQALGAENGVRNPQFSFAGNEEPPTLEQWLKIDLGNEPGKDSGLIRQIPVAITAVVPIVHFPAGCAIPAKEATGDGRFTVSNAELEKVYAGEVATWGELLPDIESSCAGIPLERVVPGGADGTTYTFKQWLGTINSHRGWTSLANTAWPNDSGATATVRSSSNDHGEAEAVAETSGSIGFSSLPSAREQRFGQFNPNNYKYGKSGLFWLSAVNGAGERVEPTRDPNSGEDNVRGANCDDPTFSYVPSGYDTTATPIWRAVSAAGSKTGWPICTLTYFLAWDDASTVFGNTTAAEANQRTVKDFLAYTLGPVGQEIAKERDYSPLTPTLLADAQEGQRRVGWEKTPGSEEAEGAVRAAINSASRHTKR
jgi:ABC-type phosphate transport system substrate-binding protein